MIGNDRVAGVLAAGVMAVSSGAGVSQSVPPQTGAPQRLLATQIDVLGARHDVNCPMTYSGCVNVERSRSGGSIELCYNPCGPANYSGRRRLRASATAAPYGRFLGSFTSNRGDPV